MTRIQFYVRAINAILFSTVKLKVGDSMRIWNNGKKAESVIKGGEVRPVSPTAVVRPFPVKKP